MMEKDFKCPNCGSDNIQRFEVAFQNGISDTSSVTTGVGIAGDGLGVGAAKTNSTSQSALSMSVAPPAKKSVVKKFLLNCVIAFFIGGIMTSYLIPDMLKEVFFAAVMLIPAYLAYKNYKWNKEEWPMLMERWHNSYICLRCGNKFEL